jgi:hypothetical protein
MKKKYLGIIAILVILIAAAFIKSCHQTTEKTQTECVFRKMEPILKEIFEKYPSYETNSIIRDSALTELVFKADSLVNLKYLEDIPLKVLSITETTDDKNAIVVFYSDNYDYNNKDILSNSLNFDIIGYVDKNTAATIDESKKYYIEGSNYKRMNKSETYDLVSCTWHSPIPGISIATCTHPNEYNIGIYSCEVNSVRQTN